ncbi:MAG: archease [Candidatus Aminicenantes bacterium]|nr:archease [Candidatus Aminicenantes bacterium]
MKKFEVFEHTADVGIIAYGKGLNEAFENAAIGMFSIITDVEKVEGIGEYRIEIEASDMEQMLVDWLSELLYIHTVKQVMFSSFKVDIGGEEGKWQLKGHASGENYDEKKHPYHTEIKAVTHHILEIKKNEGYKIQVLFDI